MTNPFFDQPILNSPYAYPARHWELDDQGQPTQQMLDSRRGAEFITPMPQPRKHKGSAAPQPIVFDEGQGLSTPAQPYDHTARIHTVRQQVDPWHRVPNPHHEANPALMRLALQLATGAGKTTVMAILIA